VSDAFQCDRCGEYNEGSGKRAQCGHVFSNFAGAKQRDNFVAAELCDDCWNGLVEWVEEYMEDVRIDERR
jgi:hypothetical protein